MGLGAYVTAEPYLAEYCSMKCDPAAACPSNVFSMIMNGSPAKTLNDCFCPLNEAQSLPRPAVQQQNSASAVSKTAGNMLLCGTLLWHEHTVAWEGAQREAVQYKYTLKRYTKQPEHCSGWQHVGSHTRPNARQAGLLCCGSAFAP